MKLLPAVTATAQERHAQAFWYAFQERYRADHATQWAPDPDAVREMVWAQSYVEHWGTLCATRAFIEANPWLLWALLTLGYSPWVLRWFL